VLPVKGRVSLASVGMLLAIGVMAWAGGVSADQPPPAYYLALGDSVAAGQGASGPDRFGYVGLFRRLFQADHQGKERFANLAVPGESSATFLGGQMARALETINDPDTNIQVVTLTLGANDLLPPIITEPAPRTQRMWLVS
jgi:lysophospholipase L1-like esterase